jgi:hypothetical protein
VRFIGKLGSLEVSNPPQSWISLIKNGRKLHENRLQSVRSSKMDWQSQAGIALSSGCGGEATRTGLMPGWYVKMTEPF